MDKEKVLGVLERMEQACGRRYPEAQGRFLVEKLMRWKFGRLMFALQRLEENWGRITPPMYADWSKAGEDWRDSDLEACGPCVECGGCGLIFGACKMNGVNYSYGRPCPFCENGRKCDEPAERADEQRKRRMAELGESYRVEPADPDWGYLRGWKR
jgi:hypothetical protein